MADWKKSVISTIAVLGAIGSFVVGNEARTRQDTGRALKAVPQSYLAGIESNFEDPRSVPEGEMFYQLLLLLERDFVEPNIDEKKLAYGAIKGTVAGLWDPLSQYLTPDELAEQARRLKGEYRGIGVELREVTDTAVLTKVRKGGRPNDPLALLPTLEVAMVVPNGPADRAGMKVGDRILSLNGRWQLGYPDILKVREAQKAVTAGKANADDFSKVRSEFQKKAKSPISAGRAQEVCLTGEGKIVDVVWQRGTERMRATITTGVTKVPGVTTQRDGTLDLHLVTGVSRELADVPSGSTIDLRNSGLGDPNEIKPVLEKLAPPGRFGLIVTDKAGQPKSLVTTKGTSSPRSYRLLVDRSTRGAAEILASALRARGMAQLEGGPMAGEPVWVATVKLDDGSGYTLNTGRFAPDTVEARK